MALFFFSSDTLVFPKGVSDSKVFKTIFLEWHVKEFVKNLVGVLYAFHERACSPKILLLL